MPNTLFRYFIIRWENEEKYESADLLKTKLEVRDLYNYYKIAMPHLKLLQIIELDGPHFCELGFDEKVGEFTLDGNLDR